MVVIIFQVEINGMCILYIKGDLGDVIDFSFRNGASGGLISDIVSHTIMYKGWHYIRLDITPSGKYK